MPEDPSRRFDLLLLGHLALFLPFAWLIRHSLQAAYLANVIPLVLVFAARGTGLVVARVTHLVGQERRIGLVSCGLAIALLAASPQVDKHDSFSARNVFLGDTHRRDIRTGLQELIPDTSPLLLGGFAFPYLHDVPYVSFWQIVAEVGQQILGRLEIDRGRGYLWVPLESLGLLQVPRPSRGPEMARLSDGVVLSDHSYWWQWDFLDARVWSADYVHVGTVFAFGQFGHQVFAKRTVPARSLAPGLYRAGTAWVLNYGYHQDPSAIAMMRLSEWRCLSEIEQYQCVEAFLVEQHMLNLIRQNTAEEESLYRAVYDRWRAAAQRSEAEGFERTLMQAFSWEQDSAMETLMRTRGVAQLGR